MSVKDEGNRARAPTDTMKFFLLWKRMFNTKDHPGVLGTREHD